MYKLVALLMLGLLVGCATSPGRAAAPLPNRMSVSVLPMGESPDPLLAAYGCVSYAVCVSNTGPGDFEGGVLKVAFPQALRPYYFADDATYAFEHGRLGYKSGMVLDTQVVEIAVGSVAPNQMKFWSIGCAPEATRTAFINTILTDRAGQQVADSIDQVEVDPAPAWLDQRVELAALWHRQRPTRGLTWAGETHFRMLALDPRTEYLLQVAADCLELARGEDSDSTARSHLHLVLLCCGVVQKRRATVEQKFEAGRLARAATDRLNELKIDRW